MMLAHKKGYGIPFRIANIIGREEKKLITPIGWNKKEVANSAVVRQ